MTFNTLEEIQTHCDTKFPNKPPLTINSQISKTTLGTKRNYSLVINLNIPLNDALKPNIQAIRNEVESIKNDVIKSGFVAKTSYGTVNGGTNGYHFNLSVTDK